MKILTLITLCLLLSNCTNHMNDTVEVVEVSKNNYGPEKYRVELDFHIFSQVLYTDEVFNVGDTLRFVVKKGAH